MKNKILYVLMFSFSQMLFAQNEDTRTYADTLQMINKDHGASDNEFVELPEMVIELKKEDLERIRTMKILQRRILRVYPYVAATSINLLSIYGELDKLDSKRDRRRYLKSQEKRLKEQFEASLKKLSRKDGRILVKLIYRQTGKSTYDLMRELKSGWSAFWANRLAWFYDINLKDSYDPYNQLEDFYIEFLLDELRKSGKIDYIEPVMKYDKPSMERKWRERLGDSGYYPYPI